MKGGTVTVATRTLDDLVPGETGRRLSLVKLDIEGAESLALAGARRLLAEHRPAIYCEFNDIVLRDAGSSAAELLEQFGAIGYSAAPESRSLERSLSGTVTDLLLLPNPPTPGPPGL
jgi:hypothetical protein